MNGTMIRTLGFGVMAAALAAGTWGQTPSPTPATTQAKAKPTPDWSTPEKAVQTWGYAYVSQDGEAIIQSIAWEDPEDKKAYTAQLEAAGQSSGKYLVEVFEVLTAGFPGDEDVKKYVDQQMAGLAATHRAMEGQLAQVEKMMADMEVNIEGDGATMSPKNGGKGIKMKRVDGKWLVTPESAGVATGAARKKQYDESVIQRMTVAAMRAEYAQFKGDVKEKKYGTGKEALAALERIPQEAMKRMAKELEALGASTQPTTRP